MIRDRIDTDRGGRLVPESFHMIRDHDLRSQSDSRGLLTCTPDMSFSRFPMRWIYSCKNRSCRFVQNLHARSPPTGMLASRHKPLVIDTIVLPSYTVTVAANIEGGKSRENSTLSTGVNRYDIRSAGKRLVATRSHQPNRSCCPCV